MHDDLGGRVGRAATAVARELHHLGLGDPAQVSGYGIVTDSPLDQVVVE